MSFAYKILKINFILLINFFSFSYLLADNHNIYETLEELKKDIKTLEKAVYSGSIEVNRNNTSNSEISSNNNSEDVLTRHLLKLSEIESQFKETINLNKNAC